MPTHTLLVLIEQSAGAEPLGCGEQRGGLLSEPGPGWRLPLGLVVTAHRADYV